MPFFVFARRVQRYLYIAITTKGIQKRHIDKIFLFVSENPEILVRSNHGCTIFSFCDKGIKYDRFRRVWEIEYININSP